MPGFDALRVPGRRLLGTWTQFADADTLDLLAAAGYDFTIIDLEHGAFGLERAVTLVRGCEAAGLVALARVPRGDHALAGRLLDAGLAGIVAPGVETAQEAHDWVRALRFGPQGTRGACPIVRAAGHSATPWRDVADRQSRVGLVLLVESGPGIEAAEAIAATPGIDGLMVGPFDLSVSLGLGGDVGAAPVQAGIARVIGAAQAAGVAPWLPVFSPDVDLLERTVDAWAARGVRHYAVGADKIFFASAARRFAAAAGRPA